MPSPQLPALREELALLPGPHLADGQPSWMLHDPVRNLFFQIDWPSFEILSRWSAPSADGVVTAVNAETTLHVDGSAVERLATFLQANQLVQPTPGSAAQMAEGARRQRGAWTQRLLHNYLFFRVPLLRPDRWLGRWLHGVDLFYSRRFLQATLLAALLGLIGIYRAWEEFSGTLVDMLTLPGMLAYGLTIATVKLLHELGHGFTAKRYGCRVPTMGIAFLVLWPVAYTDTNEVWKLRRRDQRLKVAAAGIATELIIAAWATLLWAWLPAGGPKTVAFLLATTTWVATLAINASPFMRFDGYFLLSDYLHLPNLHSRAFALARWDLRERLFALGEPVPEHFPPRRHLGLILFAWATWIYRLAIFLGIAALVYQFFFKALGILLFAVEIAWFVLMPFWNEVRAWRQRWPALRSSRRARRSALAALAAGMLFLAPWPTRVLVSAMLLPRDQFAIYAPQHAQVAALPFVDGARIAAGAPLLQLASPDIRMRSEQSDAQREGLFLQSAAAGFNAERRKDWQLLGEQLAKADAEGATVAADAARYVPIAPYAGTLRDLDPDLRVGDWVGNREFLGRLVADGPLQVVSYVDDDDVRRIAPGDRALFVADGSGDPTLRLEVVDIDRDASRSLNEPELASLFGGHVQVREKGGMLYPERAIYRVTLKAVSADASAGQHSWRGRLTIAGRWEAPGGRFLRSALAVLWREAGF